MKTATKRADELKSLFKKVLKEFKPQPLQPMEPLTALVKGTLSYDVTDERADQAMAAIEAEFTDLNELRVATELEIQDIIGGRYPAGDERASIITRSLNAIFEKEHTLSLDRLKTVRKTETRQFLRDLPGVNAFIEAYTMLFGFAANAIPVDQTLASHLIEAGIFEPETPVDEIQKFCEHHLKAEESYEFYAAMRAATARSKKKGK